MKNLLYTCIITLGLTAPQIQAATLNSNYILNTPFYTSSVYDVNLLCKSIALGNTEIVKKLIESGEDVNKKSNGLTPVMYAAKYNRVEILNYLIARGAKLKTKCDSGYTALDYAKATGAEAAQDIIEVALSKM
ncbi:ankyrin repeat domain-containing protein [Formosa sediminum]|uniref:Ankyrin repeat domain-containing protein n=1 Tax=Formosa sediminum TaxID=2594004 RepID=A0A516GQH5_9FLAO|nr:ankyrin repeat domain-containing protein [Formosa sediminum]QDO93743.1 ankyrin repeat domain-containing protein [Formosa sediminum]